MKLCVYDIIGVSIDDVGSIIFIGKRERKKILDFRYTIIKEDFCKSARVNTFLGNNLREKEKSRV